MTRINIKTPLILIIVFGAILRLWQIANFSFPPDGDEIAFSYYGWSLLHFGSDEFGNQLPLFFSSIGDFKYPGLAYLNIIPAVLFGLSDFSARFWSVTSGIIGIPLIYIFANFITNNKKASLFASLFFAISPWSLIESRLGYENHVAFVITLIGFIVLFLNQGMIKTNKNFDSKKYLFICVCLFLLASLTYAATRVFIPTFIFVIFIYTFIESKFKKSRKAIFFVFITMGSLAVLLFANPSFTGRANEEAWRFTTKDADVLGITYNVAGVSNIKVHPRITWLLHNKYSYSALEFSKRYLNHLSPIFLFFEGEASDEALPAMGLVLFIEMLLLPIGSLVLFKNHAKKSIFVFSWLLFAPLAASFTRGDADINRASLMIIPLATISGYGLWSLTSFKSKTLNILTGTILSFAILWSFLYMLHQMFIVKPTLRPWYKHQVNRELTQKVLQLRDNYEAVAVTDDDYIFYLFYGAITPDDFQTNSDVSPSSEGRWERVNRLYNIHFKMPYNCPLSGKENVLYVCEGSEIPQNSNLIDVVYYGDGLPAYSFITFYPISQMPSPLPALPDRLFYMVDTEKPDGNPDGIIPIESQSYW